MSSALTPCTHAEACQMANRSQGPRRQDREWVPCFQECDPRPRAFADVDNVRFAALRQCRVDQPLEFPVPLRARCLTTETVAINRPRGAVKSRWGRYPEAWPGLKHGEARWMFEVGSRDFSLQMPSNASNTMSWRDAAGHAQFCSFCCLRPSSSQAQHAASLQC